MSARDHDASELREEMIAKLTAEKYEAARTVVLTGSAGASGIANLLLDSLAEPGAMNVLARVALSCDAETSGQALKSFVVNALVADADAQATKEVDGAVRSDPESCQAKTRAQVVALDKLQI